MLAAGEGGDGKLRGPDTLDVMSSLLLPAVVAQASGPDRGVDVYQRLLKERIVFLGTRSTIKAPT